jgi:hypothetical protein
MTTRNIQDRFEEHISSGRNIRGSILLAQSLRDYGVINHKIELVEECDDSVVLQRESFWMNEFDTIKNGFNVHLSNIEKREKTYWNDRETALVNISNGVVWNKNISPKTETRKKISETRKENYLRGLYVKYGHKHTDKTKKELSQIIKKQYDSGRKNSSAVIYDVIDEKGIIMKMDKIEICRKYHMSQSNWKTLYKWSKENKLYPKKISQGKIHPKFKIALIGGEKYYAR